MYSKFSTQAIVLKVEDVGEKDIFLSLFTREYGFVYAKARGIRTQNSRLRFALQPLTVCFASLVHGKTGWILTNATFLHSYYFDTDGAIQRRTIIHILHLLGRLYIGEEAHAYLFDFIERQLHIISKKIIEEKNLKAHEVFIVFKLLDTLGYVQEDKILKPLLQKDECDESLILYIFEHKKLITPFINSAIRTSGL